MVQQEKNGQVYSELKLAEKECNELTKEDKEGMMHFCRFAHVAQRGLKTQNKGVFAPKLAALWWVER